MMNVVEGNDIPGLYLEYKHKFILQELTTGDVIAIGVLYGDKERVINDEEKKRAKEKGFNVMKG